MAFSLENMGRNLPSFFNQILEVFLILISLLEQYLLPQEKSNIFYHKKKVILNWRTMILSTDIINLK